MLEFNNTNNAIGYNKLNIDKNFNYTNGNNNIHTNNTDDTKEKEKKKTISKSNSKIIVNKKNKQFSNKLILPDSKDKKESLNNNSNNIPGSNTNINININNNFKTELDLLISEREQLQNIKFDNSILTKEIIGLNKEVNKFKAENKTLSENFKKTDKEKCEYLSKLKSKTEAFDKIKKENEELMIMIQNSNYKSFVSIETENKKIKNENFLLTKELENIKIDFINKDKSLKDKEIELEKLKKNFENFSKIKNDRDNLILENTKLESEYKRTRFDMEELKSLIDKQNVLLKNKDECLNKLSEEFNYLNFNAKKLKQESDKNLQDAIAYQQIVRKMEKELAETQIKKEKFENELKIIKANLNIK